MQKKIFLPTYLPYFFSGRYRKQTINFFRPEIIFTPQVLLGKAKMLLSQMEHKISFVSAWLGGYP